MKTVSLISRIISMRGSVRFNQRQFLYEWIYKS